jgi:hypothetical protein
MIVPSLLIFADLEKSDGQCSLIAARLVSKAEIGAACLAG